MQKNDFLDAYGNDFIKKFHIKLVSFNSLHSLLKWNVLISMNNRDENCKLFVIKHCPHHIDRQYIELQKKNV